MNDKPLNDKDPEQSVVYEAAIVGQDLVRDLVRPILLEVYILLTLHEASASRAQLSESLEKLHKAFHESDEAKFIVRSVFGEIK